MGKSSIRDTDKGYQKLVRTVFGFGKPSIKVGILEAEANQAHSGASGKTVGYIAEIHEFGLGGMPERSFIRKWFDVNQDKIKKAISASMQAVIAGKITKEQALERLGAKFAAEIQASLPLPGAGSPSTYHGLVDTGQLRSSITYKVQIK